MGDSSLESQSNLQIQSLKSKKNGVRYGQKLSRSANSAVGQEQERQANRRQAIQQKVCWFRYQNPAFAKQGDFIDKKCPFTGNVSIRGRLLTGVVTTLKMQRTCTIRRDYLHFVKKYNRFEKRHKNLSAHLSPAFRDIKVGDLVTVGECRPLAKTVRFNVIKINKTSGGKKGFDKF